MHSSLISGCDRRLPETVNLYWSGGNASSDLNVTQANNWSVSPTEWTPPEKMDLANNILIFDKATKNHWEPNIARASMNTSTVIAGIVNSYRTEYHVNTNGGIKVSGNYDIDVTQQLSSDGTIVKGLDSLSEREAERISSTSEGI